MPNVERLNTGINELDRVLGGGLVAGSVLLVAGEPGIGKSTLLLELANQLGSSQPVLYISGEESLEQIGIRARRLRVAAQSLEFAISTNTDDVAASVASQKYRLVIVDSIQTMATASQSTAAGTISQITASTQMLLTAAKNSRTAVIMSGHVTKEGNIAGPKILEHVVDVVLYLEGERFGHFKLLRGTKNRFGSTFEVGIFEMNESGIKPVANPSQAFLSERQISDGSVVLATIEGSRPLLVEVQALVSVSPFGYPKRTSSGFDLNRLNLLLAVLSRRANLRLATQDVYVNIVGGLRVSEPAADLAVALAIASALKAKSLAKDMIVFGEVGLSGEVRSVAMADKRLTEASKLGFKQALTPSLSADKNIKLVPVTSVAQAIKLALDNK